jgi:hypothetical protein
LPFLALRPSFESLDRNDYHIRKMPENDSQPEVPVALLSEALLELRAARGNFRATREAVIHYFTTGFAGGFLAGPLLQWLFFWPNEQQSVFSQVGYSAKESREFLEILREKHSAQELGLKNDQMPPATAPDPTVD